MSDKMKNDKVHAFGIQMEMLVKLFGNPFKIYECQGEGKEWKKERNETDVSHMKRSCGKRVENVLKIIEMKSCLVEKFMLLILRYETLSAGE